MKKLVGNDTRNRFEPLRYLFCEERPEIKWTRQRFHVRLLFTEIFFDKLEDCTFFLHARIFRIHLISHEGNHRKIIYIKSTFQIPLREADKEEVVEYESKRIE